MIWKARYSDSSESSVPYEHGQLAWRAIHIPTGLAMPIPFARKNDALQCAAICEKELPFDDDSGQAVVQRIRDKFGSCGACAKYLVEHSCAW